VPVEPEQVLATLRDAGLKPAVLSVTPNDDANGAGPASAPPSKPSASCGDPTRPGGTAQRDGCGGEVDLTADVTRLAAVRWRTYLCPTCYAAAKAST
jgi:hypothetical protein